MLTIYRIVGSYLLVAVLLQILMPLFTPVIPPQIAQQYNSMGINMTVSFIGTASLSNQTQRTGGVFQQIMEQSFGSSLASGAPKNSTGIGFFAGITIFTGLAFVFSTIGFVLEAILNVPRGMLVLMTIALSSIGISIALTAVMVYILYALMTFRIVMVGISSWMKYDLSNG